MTTTASLPVQVQAAVTGTDIEIRLGNTVVVVSFASAVDLQHELDHALAVIIARSGQRI